MAPLIEEMSEMQTAKVLSGNFDLKISRQDYFISKQDEVWFPGTASFEYSAFFSRVAIFSFPDPPP